MSIYHHFRQEEYEFIDQVVEWGEGVKTQYSPKISDFLDPREQEIVKIVIGKNSELNVQFFGGAPFTERKRVLLYPTYFQPKEDDFQLCLFELKFPSKFVSFDHRDVLGTLMSLGLKRSKFGDILIKGDLIQLIVAKEISNYVKLNLQIIGRTPISLEEQDFSKIVKIAHELQEKSITVSSMRLDVLLASVYNLSRQKVHPFIVNGNVKVNWKSIEYPAFECQAGDTFSLRGFGRCKILSIEGKTKKEKWRIIVGFQK